MQSDRPLEQLKRQSQEKPLSRRDFVRVLSIAGAAGPGMVAAGLTGFSLTGSQRAEAAEALVDGMGKVAKRKFGSRLGNMMVAPIFICQDWNQDLFEPAVQMGLNFVHKAGYWGGIPDAFKKLPRESFYTDITVDTTSPGHNPDDFDQAYNQVVSSLDRNGLKYYDIYRAHYGWHTPDKVMAAGNTSYKVFQRLKREGKVKYFGVSQHPYRGGEENIPLYPQIIDAITNSGIVDAMQVWYSYGYPKEVQEAFARASKAGIAMNAMKVFAHGHDEMRRNPDLQAKYNASGKPGRALLRYALNGALRPDGKPIFQAAVSALGNLQVFEENVGAISQKVASADGYREASATV